MLTLTSPGKFENVLNFKLVIVIYYCMYAMFVDPNSSYIIIYHVMLLYISHFTTYKQALSFL